MDAQTPEEHYLLWGWERFFTELSSFLRTAERQMENANQAFSEYVLERLQISMLSLSALMDQLRSVAPSDTQQGSVSAYYYSEIAELLVCVREIASQWERHIDEQVHMHAATSYSAPHENVARVGRPRFDITREQLQYLASMSFSWSHIAGMLGVSRSTLYRRRLEYQLVDYARENITDEELRSVLLHLRRESPASGEVMVWGALRAMGFIVRRQRLRQAIREIDPLHTALRWRGDLTGRRPYSVPGPNSLWHMGKME